MQNNIGFMIRIDSPAPNPRNEPIQSLITVSMRNLLLLAPLLDTIQ